MSGGRARLSFTMPGEPGDGSLVAFGRDCEVDRSAFADGVASLAAAVGKVGRGHWLLYTEDPYAAAVSLLALLQSGSSAVLSPNRQSGTLRSLASGVRGVLLDAGIDTTPLAGHAAIAPLGGPPAPQPEWKRPSGDALVVELCTSGTTAEGKRIPKALRHLEEEIATLDALFAQALPEDACVFGTVSHQHIYGLLFRVLWPLATGRPFQAETLLHTRELLPRMAERGSCALVSTPAHLRRVVAAEGLGPLRGVCHAVFSSGATLDADTARAIAEQLGAPPFEILGSTETGGVAVRQQGVCDDWSPLPGVAIEREPPQERLAVTSGFVSVGEPRGGGRRRFVMGDRIELRAGGRFALQDRVDRTVKVAGKRLSLPEMERELERHAWVEETALVILRRGSEPRVHAVVVPSDAGRDAVGRAGRRTLTRALEEHLAARFDRVLRPRGWRVVDALPRNAQGKLPAAALRALFEEPARDPIVVEEVQGPGRLQRRIEIPRDLAYLEGHFEGHPLVAGVVQLEWAIEAGASLLGHRPSVRVVEALKFPSVLEPGARCDLIVELSEDGRRLRFQLREGARIFASGRCVLDR